MDKFLLVLVATFGGVLVSILGWLDSKEPFDAKKFAASFIRALFAGCAWALGYTIASGTLSVTDLIIALLSGTTFDTVVNRIGSRFFGNPYFPFKPGKLSTDGPVIPPSKGAAA